MMGALWCMECQREVEHGEDHEHLRPQRVVSADLDDDEMLFAEAADELQAAEEEEAVEFLRLKVQGVGLRAGRQRSDWEARAEAMLNTKGRTARARAALEIARARLYRGKP